MSYESADAFFHQEWEQWVCITWQDGNKSYAPAPDGATAQKWADEINERAKKQRFLGGAVV